MMLHVPECTCATCRRERRALVRDYAIMAAIYLFTVIMGLRALAHFFA